MGFWSIITGAGKASEVIDKGLDIVGSAARGLDTIVYTDEEKAQDGASMVAANMAQALEFAKLSRSESGASAVTRRVFGLIILANFSLFVVSGLVCIFFGREDITNNIINLAKALSVGQLAAAVVVSTFGYYALTGQKK